MLIEEIELTLSHVNLGCLSEVALMTLFGVGQSHRITEGRGISIRGIQDAGGQRLYPGYFTTHLTVPPGRRLEGFEVWDRIEIGTEARAFGSMILETEYVLGRKGEVPREIEAWKTSGLPTMRAGTMFIIDGRYGEPTPAVPRAGLLAEMPALRTRPLAMERFTEVQKRGAVDPHFEAMIETKEPIRMPLVSKRDVAAGRALMFASFIPLMDVAERALLATGFRGMSHDLIDTASISDREVHYFVNCGAGETVLVFVGLSAARNEAADSSSTDVTAPIVLEESFELVQERTNQLLACARATKVLAIPRSRPSLVREADRWYSTLERRPIRGSAAVKKTPPIVRDEPSSLEERIAEMVARVLEHRGATEAHKLALDDDFGRLGLDSFGIVELCAQIERACRVELSPESVIAHPTVRGLAEWIGGLATTRDRLDPVPDPPPASGAERLPDGRFFAWTTVNEAALDESAWRALISSSIARSDEARSLVIEELLLVEPSVAPGAILATWLEPGGRFRVEGEVCHARGRVRFERRSTSS
jgi:probable biosynthetic protein (TIGR04098 family)